MPKKFDNSKNKIGNPIILTKEDALYGTKTMPIGDAFKRITFGFTHYFLQRENDVLHVNTIHNG